MLDDIRERRILDAIEKGATRRAAAAAAGVSRDALQGWIAKGRFGLEPYADFVHRLEQAEAVAENELVAVIRSAATRSWQAAAWLLERRRPRTYGPHRLKPGELKPMTEEEADRILAEAAELHALTVRQRGTPPLACPPSTGEPSRGT